MNGPTPMEKLARHIASALGENQPQGPYYLLEIYQDWPFAHEIAPQFG
jgi:hypothetical protein